MVPFPEGDVYLASERVEGVPEQFTHSARFNENQASVMGELLGSYTHWSQRYLYGTACVSGFHGVGNIITDAVIHNAE